MAVHFLRFLRLGLEILVGGQMYPGPKVFSLPFMSGVLHVTV